MNQIEISDRRLRPQTQKGRGLPDGYWLCTCGMATFEPVCRCGRAQTPDPVPDNPQPTRSAHRPAGPTKTEAEYARRYLTDHDARYEALTFRMSNGHRYTPDWTYWQDGTLWAVEVKGSHRLGSYQRARLAYDQARVEFPCVRWVWAERQVDGGWRISHANMTTITNRGGQ